MYLKHIICTVKPNNKLAFSDAQKKWIETKNAKGFIAQIGGWNIENNTEAIIFSFWVDKLSLEKFMGKFHDDIFHKSDQSNTYERIKINHFNYSDIGFLKESFIQKIDALESIETIITKDDSTLKLKFSKKSLFITNHDLENKVIKLENLWKIT